MYQHVQPWRHVHVRRHLHRDWSTLRLLTASARDVAVEVARRLFDPATLHAAVRATAATTAYPEVTVWRPSALTLGDVGLALLGVELHGRAPDDGWDRLTHRHLSAAVNAVSPGGLDDHHAPLSLFGGWTGLAAVATLAAGAATAGQFGAAGDTGRYRHLRARLDGWLLVRLREAAERVAAAPGGSLPAEDVDLVTGVAGGVAYLTLRQPDRQGDAVIAAQAKALVRLLGDDDVPRRVHSG